MAPLCTGPRTISLKEFYYRLIAAANADAAAMQRETAGCAARLRSHAKYPADPLDRRNTAAADHCASKRWDCASKR
jgi:hypothetical protein